jgi:HlyD family secretion protein
MVILGIVAVAAVTGFYFFNRNKQPDFDFQTAPATRGELTQSVTATGTLNPVLNVQVGSQVSGNIQKLFADWNSRVNAGQIVAQIDPTNYQATVTQAEGDLANARAALELAQIQVKRSQGLRAKDSTPQASLDQAVAALHQAEASVKTKEGSLALARANFQHCSIISPVDGIVISRNVDVGQTVAASLNAPVIFVIANDLAKMQIDTNVSEGDVGNVQEGQEVDFMVDAFPYRTFHGKVRQVRNAAISVQNVVTYDAVIDVNNEDLKLKPGMTANASIIVARSDDALKISNAALRVRLPEVLAAASGSPGGAATSEQPAGKKKENDPARRTSRTVYVLADGENLPKPVQIKIGISDGAETEVLEGLKEGDKVVTAILSSRSPDAGAASNPFGPPRMR